jgi:hypothetical protein
MRTFDMQTKLEHERRMRMPIIPAYPGFLLLEFDCDPRKEEPVFAVRRLPIIGWRYDGDQAYPITPFETCGEAILCPNGRVICPFADFPTSFESETEWLRDITRKIKERALEL